MELIVVRLDSLVPQAEHFTGRRPAYLTAIQGVQQFDIMPGP